jgi:hypothetical protein
MGMRWAAVLFLAGFWGVPALAAPPATAGDERALIQAAQKKVDADDAAGALAILQEAAAAPGFDQIDDRERYRVRSLIAATAIDSKDYQTAVAASRLATASTYATQESWYLRFWASFRAGDKADAAASMTVLARNASELLGKFKLRLFYGLVHDVSALPGGEEQAMELIKALHACHWQPSDEAAENADMLWLRLLRHDIETRDATGAQEIAAVIVSPDVVVTMNSLKLYDPVVASAPDRFNIAKAYATAAERAKARIAAEPALLSPVVDASLRLFQLGRLNEARNVIEAALSKLAAGAAFTDKAENLNWLYDNYARVLFAMGRSADAIAVMKAGIRAGESGSPNVSQIINLADFYLALDRPQEALAALAPLDSKTASPYGVLAAEQVRAIAYALLGEREKSEASLNIIRAGAAPVLALQTLLRCGRGQEAEQLALKYLADPKTREGIVEMLHRTMAPPHASANGAKWGAKVMTLGSREAVRQAVAAFGRILDLPLLSYS